MVNHTDGHSGSANSGNGRNQRVVIVGGGLAGLAAASALVRHGVPVDVWESRNRLGGRASSFRDQQRDEWVDNCQHVGMGCCTNFRDFCEITGLWPHFARQKTLFFVAPDGRVSEFAGGSLPAPMHLTGAFLGLPYLTLTEKLRLAWGLRALVREPAQPVPGRTTSFGEWLAAHGQTPRIIRRFWQVVLISALSETLDRIEIAAARKVFVDGFLTHPSGWQVDLPLIPFDELYSGPLWDWFEQHDARLELQTALEHLEHDPAGAWRLKRRGGDIETAETVILAVPWYRAQEWLSAMESSGHGVSEGESTLLRGAGAPAARIPAAKLSQLEAAPISSVHLWVDRPFTDLPHAAFVEGLCQWMFTRGRAAGAVGETTGTDTWYYQIVISASREAVALGQDETVRRVWQELQHYFPRARAAQLVYSRQVTEHRAVFSPIPGSDDCRPVQRTAARGLYVAGDWTATGWPATMEGAVRSGYLAAEAVLADRGQPVQIVQPGLPVSPWFQRLFGRTPV